VLKQIFSEKITVVLIPEVTRGATETVLKAAPFVSSDEDIIILDCDNIFDGMPLLQAIQNKTANVAAIMPVFVPPDKEIKYSYTLFDQEHNALAIGEKDRELANRELMPTWEHILL